ncbi:MAG TPA: histidinol dehydrogenase [Bacillota bacterium]|nr:histidinol dehydrogenase [Bacillota bacterium]
MIREIDGRGKEIPWIREELNRPSQLEAEKELGTVLSIVRRVRDGGDTALLAYTSKYDRVDISRPQGMRVTAEEIQEAYDKTDKKLVAILEKAADRIRSYHAKQKQESWLSFDEEGVLLGQKVTPMERVGLYVPGGKAAYPSSVLMNAIPAQVAGVEEIVMVSPPKKGGKIHSSILAAARVAGIEEIYKVGGAQAIAALAYGTDTIGKVDKIVGPGNIYVALAKKEVYGQVDIDMIAGPSEIVVLADKTANPSFIAADLMSQAEHDAMASAILITDSDEISKGVRQELEKQIEKQPLKDTIFASLRDYGACIVVNSISEAIKMSNDLAPEHLELAVENPMNLVGQVKHAGAIFLGHYTPEPVGDYMAGPNHVLPTSGTARFFSPLGVDDFIKKSSIASYNRQALGKIFEDVADFARMEGLPAHANAMEVRFKEDV